MAWLLSAGCTRHAPTPERCLSMAQRFEAHTIARGLPLRETVTALTLRCIDEPFEPRLVECIGEGYEPSKCLQLGPGRALNSQHGPL